MAAALTMTERAPQCVETSPAHAVTAHEYATNAVIFVRVVARGLLARLTRSHAYFSLRCWTFLAQGACTKLSARTIKLTLADLKGCTRWVFFLGYT